MTVNNNYFYFFKLQTIIEALKYAITSQFPPNSAKGASFVNDPKLTYGDKVYILFKLILFN